MTLLAIETASVACSVALLHKEQVIERFQVAPRRHVELVMPMIEQVLAEAQCDKTAIDAIAYGAGPGAFTGVRIAAAITQGLALGLDVPAIAISSLQALAQFAHRRFQVKNVLAGFDARMGEIYSGHYVLAETGIMKAVCGDELLVPTQLCHIATDIELAIGDAWASYDDLIVDKVESIQADYFPSARDVVLLAKHRYEAKQLLAAEQVLPCYLRNNVAKKSAK